MTTKVDTLVEKPANLGYGVGFRPVHFEDLCQNKDDLDWIEVVTENYLGVGGKPRRLLHELRRDLPVVAHGVSLSIAGTAPLRRDYLAALKEFVQEYEPDAVTDHLCWTGDAHWESHDLLPLPYTLGTLRHVCDRVDQVQEILGRTITLENPSAYVAFAGHDASSELHEADFLQQLSQRTGCGILLDLNNLVVNQHNLGIDPLDYMSRLRPEHVRQFHLAGHMTYPDIRIDTHSRPVCGEVWALYAVARAAFPQASTLVEWDDDLPPFADLLATLQKAREVAAEVPDQYVPLCNTDTVSVSSPSDNAEVIGLRQFQSEFKEQMQSAAAGISAGLGDFTFQSAPAHHDRGFRVYQEGYGLRLVEVLQEDFPVLFYILEEQAFSQMVLAFLKEQPSTEFSIDRVGTKLAPWLRTADLPFDPGVETALLSEIAALEWAKKHAWMAPDTTLLTAEDFALDPDQWPNVRLGFHPSMTLLECHWDILPVMSQCEAGEQPDIPDAKNQVVVVFRNEEAVMVEAIGIDEAPVLRHFSDGAAFGDDALWTIKSEEGSTLDPTTVMSFLAKWHAWGLLSEISTDGTNNAIKKTASYAKSARTDIRIAKGDDHANRV